MFGFTLNRDPWDITDLDARVGKNSEVFTLGDAVVEASGFLQVAGSTDRLLGFVNVPTVTMASNNQTVAQVTVEFEPAYYGRKFEADFNAAVTPATAQGFYANLTGTTGAQQLDQGSLSATTGQFFIAKLDPRGTGSTTRALCYVAQSVFAIA